MSTSPLHVSLGPRAAEHIAEHGWRGRDISLLLGASGGPKWLILGHLDRVLFSEFLLRDREQALRAVGSSVGSWRHACLAQEDPIAAIDRFEDVYVNWEYSEQPNAEEVSAASAAMLAHIFGDAGARAIVEHPTIHSYIVTARGRGFNSANSAGGLVAGMGSAAVLNSLNRRLLASQFQRVLFASTGAPTLPLSDFETQHVPMSVETVAAALHASGSIPFVLAGERDIPGAPRGHYWDGGIIDYHFDLEAFGDESLVLYPHFRPDLTIGWFDKFLPWRRQRPPSSDNLILICPSEAFIASLPHGKIPDRSDFTAMPTAERLEYWGECIERSRELAEAFRELVTGIDPLAGVNVRRR